MYVPQGKISHKFNHC